MAGEAELDRYSYLLIFGSEGLLIPGKGDGPLRLA